MKTHRCTMKKRSIDSPKTTKKQWTRSKASRPTQETLRSISAPQAVRTPPAPARVRTPVRSLSAVEQPNFRNNADARPLDDKYDFAYLDVTSPSEDEEDKHNSKSVYEEVEHGKLYVGPPKKVVTSLLPGSGLQRAQVRPAVKSFNTRVRDLASVLPHDTNTNSSPPPTRPVRTKATKCWLEDEFKDGSIRADSVDLEDIDEVETSMKCDEKLLEIEESSHVTHEEKYEEKKTETFNMEEHFTSQGAGETKIDVNGYDAMKIEEHLSSLKMGERNRLKLEGKLNQQLESRFKNIKLVVEGRITPPASGMLAVKEDDLEDEVSEFPPEAVPVSGGDMAALMENMKKGGLSTRQTQLSQLASSQSALSQQLSTQVTSSTSSTTQMVSNSSTSHSTTSRQLASARLHHLTSAEMKAKSDISELKNSITEMKNLTSAVNNSFSQRLRSSIENLVDATDPDNEISEPLVTFPDPETPPVPVVSPPPLTPSLVPPLTLGNVNDAAGINSTSSLMDTMKFEQKRMTSASSKTKMVRENFSASEGASTEVGGMQNYQGKGARTQHQRIAREEVAASHTAAAFTQEQRSQEALKVDSFSSQQAATSSTSSIAQQQARQTMTSGVFSSQEKHVAQSNMTITSSKNVSTKSSVISSASQIGQLMNGTVTTSDEDLANMKFDDLDRLCAQSSQKEVDTAIAKYSSRMDAFVKTLKKHQAGEVDIKKATTNLNKVNEMIRRAWAVPTYGHELGYSLCNVLRNSGGLDLLMSNCVEDNDDLQFSSAQLLEQCLTTENRAHVVDHGLEKVVTAACRCTKKTNSVDHSRVGTGILEHLFKHSEETCSDVIKLGGLESVLFECRKNDIEILRHCAGALANLSLYGGAENQEAMINRKVPMWLFPLALHNDDNIKYYACLAIAVLVANSEIEAAVLKSGTLDLVEPFVTTHNPSDFARSNLAHAHGQSKNWLQRLVPVLSSKREEARNLAAFHFCMEAGIKKQQGNTTIFKEIGAIEPLKIVASCPNAVASKYAARALRLIGEEIPHKLSQQVPLWSADDVREWVKQIGFSEYATSFLESRVDGDLLLQLTEENLKNDIGLSNGIKRQRFIRELQNLKKMADYSSKDAGNLHSFLQSIGIEYGTYTYPMINAGVDKETIRMLSDEQLETECCITNSIHRQRILSTIRANENNLSSISAECLDKSLDVFVSYRRSNGSQLASLLKVHLQLRGFSVFIDVERLEAGKFDNNLLQSIRQAKHFLLVLTPKALDRCISDSECKDWIHREIVAALESQCNIIPIIDNFAWPEPEELPEDMRQVCHFNGVRWIHDYQDACVDKLERFMRGELKDGFLGRNPLVGNKEGGTAPATPGTLARPPPTYQRMHSSDSNKGSDKDQNGRTE